MIACDQCSEWYHYSCLGLPEPESEGATDFVCPDCDRTQHMRVVVDDHAKEIQQQQPLPEKEIPE